MADGAGIYSIRMGRIEMQLDSKGKYKPAGVSKVVMYVLAAVIGIAGIIVIDDPRVIFGGALLILSFGLNSWASGEWND